MTESQTQPTETAQTEQVEGSENFVQRFANKRPRIAKVLALTGVATTAIAVATVARTIRSNKDHLENAGQHFSEGTSELVATVDPASPEA